MNKAIFSLILCAALLSSCMNQEPIRIQVVDEKNVPVPNADVEFQSKNYKTDAKGFCELPYVSSQNKFITVSKLGYFEENKRAQFGADRKTLIIHLEAETINITNPVDAPSNQFLEELEEIDSYDDGSNVNSSENREAEFPGGVVGLQNYINQNIRYPASAIDKNEQGKVFMSFMVEKNGSISSIKVEKGLSKELNAESIRVVESMPRWTPGYVDGVRSRTRCVVPIVFVLD